MDGESSMSGNALAIVADRQITITTAKMTTNAKLATISILSAGPSA